MTTATRTVRLGDQRVPVVLPSVRDARLHTAAVIVSVHVIGITALGFAVSVPQILAAIATAGFIDIAMTYRASGKLIWPASGMLTGSGVALILRLVGMESGNYWSWDGWYWFALVAGVSILTKYAIRWRGQHVFNPSNLGLVLAFLIVSSSILEPLDFWWAPLGPAMIAAYVVIIGGGVLITRRLHLIEMAGVFWVVLAGGLGILSASGHCMVATWAPTPVCGAQFWTALVTSPEILIFLFFMITDPKTIPPGRAARVIFAGTLAVFTTLMIAPHTLEYGAKVGLLASLVLWSPLRSVFERALPATSGARSGLGELFDRVGQASPKGIFTRGIAGGVAVVMVVMGIVVAGGPARQPALAATEAREQTPDVPVDVAALPEVAVGESVNRLSTGVDDEFVELVTLMLAENLAIEAEAIRTADGSLLGQADGGTRLDELQARLDEAIATGERRADHHSFDTLSLELHEAAGQDSAGLAFEAAGTVDRVVYDAFGVEISRTTGPFHTTFILRQLAGDRWLIVATEPG